MFAYKCKFLQTGYFRSEPSGWQACVHFNQSRMVNHRTTSQMLKASTLHPAASERLPPQLSLGMVGIAFESVSQDFQPPMLTTSDRCQRGLLLSSVLQVSESQFCYRMLSFIVTFPRDEAAKTERKCTLILNLRVTSQFAKSSNNSSGDKQQPSFVLLLQKGK